MKKKYIAGFIVTSNQLDAPHYANTKLPIVALDRAINEKVPVVSSNNKEGAILGTNALLERGCRNILFLRGPEALNPANDRHDGFMEAIGKAGADHRVVTCPFQYAESQKIAERELRNDPGIDGIFASSDVSAAGALKAAVLLGRKVPDDLQIVGFDGIAMGEMLSPGLSTVAQDVYKMGAIATRVLIKRIENKPVEESFYEIPVKLILRGTTRSVE